MKTKVLSPIVGLSILGSGLLLPTVVGIKPANAEETESPSAPITQTVTNEEALESVDSQAESTDESAEAVPVIAQNTESVEIDTPPGTGEVPTVESPAGSTADPVETTPDAEQTIVDTPESPAPEGGSPGPVFIPSETSPPAETLSEPPPPEPQVLVAEVVVEGTNDSDLIDAVYDAIATRPGATATRSQIQSDINAIFTTGFFNDVQAQPADTPLGVRVTYVVSPNPVLRAVQLSGNTVLMDDKVDEIFSPQYGKTLNLNSLQSGIAAINQFYQDSGFVLGQVIPGSERVEPDGTVTLQVAEGEIEDIGIRFQNDEGEPVKGRTKPYIITRELRTMPGEILNREKLQADIQQVFGLGLFEDVQVALEPGEDPRKVVVNLNVQERSTGSFSAGAGFSSNSGLFGTGSYTQSNLLGKNLRLNAQAQVGTRDFLFDLGLTNPWIKGDPYRTSYTINAFNRLTLPLVFDGGVFDDVGIDDVDPQFRFVDNGDGTFTQDPNGDFIGFETQETLDPVTGDPVFFADEDTEVSPAEDVLDNPPCGILLDPGNTPCDVRLVDTDEDDDGNVVFDNLDVPRVNRLGAGISFTRALTKNRDKRARAWVASAGVRYERVTIRDSDLDLVAADELGNPLSFSGVIQDNNGEAITDASDDLFTVQFGLARDLRNDGLSPTKGSFLRAGVEQALPIGQGAIGFTRLRASYSQFLPIKILRQEGPQALAFNVQGGTIIGDLPPYEAFNLGGSNSVRGFDDGDVGSGRSFVQATAEYRFPLLKFLGGIGGVVFADYGTVLGTDNDVPGTPSIIRGKPGDGFGFGGGVRVKTPIGPVRLDFAFNGDGGNEFHFGFGERF